MKVIGLTGGIASGKSMVAKFLRAYPIIDADRVAREMVQPGSPGLARVVTAFGTDVLTRTGELDRMKVRNMIANNSEHQQTINQILHPLIIEEILNKINILGEQGATLVFVSAALMLETGSYRRYDAVLLVTAPLEVRLRRLLARDNMDEQTARNLIAKQWPDSRKRRLADAEVVNDGDLQQLATRTAAALKALGIEEAVITVPG